MQDRLKIRMFDKNSKKMYSFENDCLLEACFECLKQQLAFDDGSDIYKPIAYNHIQDGRIFMQCTGLKDKNGKLIYEADILKFNTVETKGFYTQKAVKIGYVRIPPKTFVAQCYDNKNNCTAIIQDNWENAEVIGNVFENNELLESEEG